MQLQERRRGRVGRDAERAYSRVQMRQILEAEIGATFSVVAVAPRNKVAVAANAGKLKIVDERAAIQHNASNGCGMHVYGRVESKTNLFYGLDFVHTELSLQNA